MICPRCGASVASGKKFCGDCGSPLPWQCSACGSENPPGKRFCADCGAASGTGPSALQEAPVSAAGTPSAERRQLTVMFADLVGSTALGTRLDPEDLREVIATYHDCITGLVTRFGGFVARYFGDGVLVYFGYPQAHEDDPERAIRAGLAIAEAVGRLSTLAGPAGTLSTPVGIATGLVVVGDLIGSGSSLESQVVGETPNLAARLQGLAEPGKVVIAEATQRLTAGLFEYQGIGPVSLKGLEKPVSAWAVMAESDVDSRFEALRPDHVSLVDRKEEMALLMRRWDQAKNGEGCVVLLAGEPGIGKSRLMAALEQNVAQDVHARLRFLCSSHYHDTPLHPLIRHLERTANFQRGDSHATKREKLHHALAPSGSSNTDVVLLAELLSIVDEASDLPDGLTPQRRKEMTAAATVRMFENLARQVPVLAMFEDIHWADPTSLALLDVLIESLGRWPILLVITSRPDLLPAWAARPQVTVQILSGLPKRDAALLVGEVLGTQGLPDDVVERIIAGADGVPLFIEELTKTVVERSALRGDTDEPLALEPLSPEMVPTSLQASLMARLDRVASHKDIAQIGSVIGREFSFEMLHALSGMPQKRLGAALDELAGTGLIIARGQPPDATYTFKHGLVQDAAYGSLLRDRRRALHLRFAGVLEADAHGAKTTEPELLAWHFAEAGAPDRSVDYYLKAAERAKGRFALAEIVSHMRKALPQLAQLPASTEKLQRELTVQVSLGRALIDHEGSGSIEVRTAFERAREVSLELDDTTELLRIHDGLGNYHFTHSEPMKVLQYTRELLDLGLKTGNPQAFLMARRSAGVSNLILGRFEEAREELELLLSIYEPERDGPQYALTTRDPKVSGCTVLGMCLTALGHVEAGAAISAEGVNYGETLNHPISLILGMRRHCVVHMMQRNAPRVLALSGRLLTMDTEYQTFLGTREGTIFNSWAQLSTQPDDATLGLMRGTIEQLDAAKHYVMLPFFMAAAAELMGAQGDEAGAVTMINRAAELVGLTSERWCEAEVMRLQARLCPRDPDHAVGLLQASLALAREQKAKLWELRTATTLAQLWRDQGRHAEARDLLAPIHAWFTEGLGAPDVVAARTLLDELN